MFSRSTARLPGALSVGQAQAAPDGLLDQRIRACGAERNNRIEIRYVPALLEHVDVDDDFRRLVRVLHFEQALNHLLFFRAGLAGVNLDDLVLVGPRRTGRTQ